HHDHCPSWPPSSSSISSRASWIKPPSSSRCTTGSPNKSCNLCFERQSASPEQRNFAEPSDGWQTAPLRFHLWPSVGRHSGRTFPSFQILNFHGTPVS
uniref:Uncharacterized protein n=1 Tax=Kryptolebias marmoratus TaxID=37003 RepID=A0A3Q2ZLX7_KRYMA